MRETERGAAAQTTCPSPASWATMHRMFAALHRELPAGSGGSYQEVDVNA